MKIEAARKNQDRSSLAVCLDTILLAEGVTKNTQNLLQHGDTPYSILQENGKSDIILTKSDKGHFLIWTNLLDTDSPV